jgi:hypothetical protein
MAPRRDDTIKGLNEYIEGLQKGGQDMRLTIFTFNSYHCLPRRSCPISQATALTDKEYAPDGMTPLYDALGGILEGRSPADFGDPSICVVITDGLENDSKKFTRERISELIGHLQEDHKWEFVYLGANQDAWAVGSQLGVHQHSTRGYKIHRLSPMYQGLAGATVCYAAAMAANPSATPDFFAKDDDLGQETPDSN